MDRDDIEIILEDLMLSGGNSIDAIRDWNALVKTVQEAFKAIDAGATQEDIEKIEASIASLSHRTVELENLVNGIDVESLRLRLSVVENEISDIKRRLSAIEVSLPTFTAYYSNNSGVFETNSAVALIDIPVQIKIDNITNHHFDLTKTKCDKVYCNGQLLVPYTSSPSDSDYKLLDVIPSDSALNTVIVKIELTNTDYIGKIGGFIANVIYSGYATSTGKPEIVLKRYTSVIQHVNSLTLQFIQNPEVYINGIKYMENIDYNVVYGSLNIDMTLTFIEMQSGVIEVLGHVIGGTP